MSLVNAPHLALVDGLRLLPPAARAALFSELEQVPGALADVGFDWPGFWGRPAQIIEPSLMEQYSLIVITGARGEGKTRAANQLFVREVDEGRAVCPRIFGATEADVDKAVIHGRSGIMTHLDPEQRRRWRWMPDEGPAGTVRVRNKLGQDVEIICFTAKATEGAVSHAGDLDLYDDVAKWGPRAVQAWTHARLSCREGYACGVVATTRRGTALLRKLLEGRLDGVLVRRLALGSNAGNLAAKWRANIKAELDDVAGDLLREDLDDEDVSAASPFAGIDFDRRPVRVLEAGDLVESVVAVDPAEGKGGTHDEWGIGAAGRRRDRHVVVLEDRSGSYDDAEAGAAILDLCERRGIDKIVVEDNRGRERVYSVIRAAHYKRELDRLLADPNAKARPLPEIICVTAKENKRLRAGPVRTLYLDGMLHHMPGLGLLEKQQREWDPDAPKRPRVDDRIDWLVHAAHHLADLAAGVGLPPEEAFEGFAAAQDRMPGRGYDGGQERGGRWAREV